MSRSKILTLFLTAVALMTCLTIADATACQQPFEITNNTGRNITSITIHYCNGTDHLISPVGPGPVHLPLMIPCGTICEISIDVDFVFYSKITVPHMGPLLPFFPGDVDATQGHIHFAP